MNSHVESQAGRGDLFRPLRYLLRTPLLLLHFLVVTPICVLLVTPLTRNLPVGGMTLEEWVIRRWSITMVRLFGFRLRVFGEVSRVPTLFVANHVSWLDIEVLHSVRMMCFVAKWEISRWPVVGWLAGRAGTIYHRRGNTQSLSDVQKVMVERIEAGRSIGVFPEGTTNNGTRVGPFHARIFQVAVQSGALIQPVALRYGRDGRINPRVPFTGDESFVVNLLRVLGEPVQEAELHFLPTIDPADPSVAGRRGLAEVARRRIVKVLHPEAHE